MSSLIAQSPASAAQRIEELGRIILAYSEVTEKLQQSHAQLTQTVEMLREELSEKNQQLERRNRLAALGARTALRAVGQGRRPDDLALERELCDPDG